MRAALFRPVQCEGAKRQVKQKISFRRKLMTAVLCVTVPLIVLLFVSNFYSIHVFNDKLAESNQRSMDYHAERIEDGLEAVDEFLTGVMVTSVDFRTLSGGATQLNAYLASYSLFSQLKAAMPAYEDLGALFIYSVPSATERDMFTEEFSYAEKNRDPGVRARGGRRRPVFLRHAVAAHGDRRRVVPVPVLRRPRHVSGRDGAARAARRHEPAASGAGSRRALL